MDKIKDNLKINKENPKLNYDVIDNDNLDASSPEMDHPHLNRYNLPDASFPQVEEINSSRFGTCNLPACNGMEENIHKDSEHVPKIKFLGILNRDSDEFRLKLNKTRDAVVSRIEALKKSEFGSCNHAFVNKNNSKNSKYISELEQRDIVNPDCTWGGNTVPSSLYKQKSEDSTEYVTQILNETMIGNEENPTFCKICAMFPKDFFYHNVNGTRCKSSDKVQNKFVHLNDGIESETPIHLNENNSDNIAVPMKCTSHPQFKLPPSFKSILELDKDSKDNHLAIKKDNPFHFDPLLISKNDTQKNKNIKIFQNILKLQSNKTSNKMDQFTNQINQHQVFRVKAMRNPNMEKLKEALFKMIIFMIIMLLGMFMFCSILLYGSADPEALNDAFSCRSNAVREPEAMLSDMWLNLKEQNKKAICVPNDGLTFSNTAAAFPEIVFLPQAPLIKMTEIYSKCGKNFTLVLYSRDASNFNFTLADVAKCFSTDAPLIPMEWYVYIIPKINKNITLPPHAVYASSSNFTLTDSETLFPSTAPTVPVQKVFHVNLPINTNFSISKHPVNESSFNLTLTDSEIVFPSTVPPVSMQTQSGHSSKSSSFHFTFTDSETLYPTTVPSVPMQTQSPHSGNLLNFNFNLSDSKTLFPTTTPLVPVQKSFKAETIVDIFWMVIYLLLFGLALDTFHRCYKIIKSLTKRKNKGNQQSYIYNF